ncbi:uncharacterized protein (DUF305 family) [Microbacterium terrae]|uniref:DUF305 domain-containing protein n=1 Tax=Microbacterium terrae TaxID=69369 RepID=A0A0M2H0X7_9MICO|nr:DUF305 domain-containing protein [Microbacterium terrae]KJL37665.1 hypothetical protein RS81_03423 [Microbacterium terrae]MBP1076497.1 uncharacterized protein (DUF305 family) [Microbacterium terrae]GLJ97326.1 DUF305 domain-containing protein [Microbacterium terrae]
MTDGSATTPTPTGRSTWWLVVVALVLIAGLAFAVGRFSTFGSQGEASTPGTTSPEAGFSRDMQVHHAQAIAMAMEIYRKTDDEDLRALSYDIATGQAGQRGEMYDWLVKWGLPRQGGPMMQWMSSSDAGHDHGVTDEALTDDEAEAAMGMATDAELDALAQADGQAADCLFLELMIRHHEGAVPMAEALLELGSDKRALQVAEAIKAGQTSEIAAMQSMQARLGCTG